jgi:hypothetical protein
LRRVHCHPDLDLISLRNPSENASDNHPTPRESAKRGNPHGMTLRRLIGNHITNPIPTTNTKYYIQEATLLSSTPSDRRGCWRRGGEEPRVTKILSREKGGREGEELSMKDHRESHRTPIIVARLHRHYGFGYPVAERWQEVN